MYLKHSTRIYAFISMLALTIVSIVSAFSFSSSAAHTPNIPNTETASQVEVSVQPSLIAQGEQFSLPTLPYEYDALDAYIDRATMTLHHDEHHASYVKNLNEAIALYPNLKGQSVEELLMNLDSIPEDIRTTIRNNGGGHANHTMFWSIMTPDSQGQPVGEIAEAIDRDFDDFATFQTEFNTAGAKQFGSGWAWLVMNSDGSLEVTSTPNQDNPLSDGKYPILGNDVWEHAYYLKYQNKRTDYLDAWWNVVNWDEINNRVRTAKAFFQN